MNALPQKVLVNAASGVGTNLLAIPLLRRLWQEFPGISIVLLVRFDGVKNLLGLVPYIGEIVVLDYRGLRSIRSALRVLAYLRRQRFDLCINAFPSARLDKRLFSFLTGARRIVGHRYRGGLWTRLFRLQDVEVDTMPGMHDVEQNLNLLSALGLDPGAYDREITVPLSEEDVQCARDLFLSLGIQDEAVVAMHPGSSEGLGMKLKRWPAEKFVRLGGLLVNQYGVGVLVVGGDDEETLKREIAARIGGGASAIGGLTLRQLGAVFKRAACLISNDTGLMHLASAVGCRVIAIFGPTDPARTGPCGVGDLVIRNAVACSPCWSVENRRSRIVCTQPYRKCLEDLAIDEALGKIGPLLKERARSGQSRLTLKASQDVGMLAT